MVIVPAVVLSEATNSPSARASSMPAGIPGASGSRAAMSITPLAATVVTSRWTAGSCR